MNKFAAILHYMSIVAIIYSYSTHNATSTSQSPTITLFTQPQNVVHKNISDNNWELPEYPPSSIILKYKLFTVSYNKKMHIPNWVAWKMDKNRIKECLVANNNGGYTGRYIQDPNLKEYGPIPNDYAKSGYDRGHMCPADYCYGTNYIKCWYMSNFCPQKPKLNRYGSWKRLEDKGKTWVFYEGNNESCEGFEVLYTVCGPVPGDIIDYIVTKRQGPDGKPFKIAVPGSYFKAFLGIKDQKIVAGIGFICKQDGSAEGMSIKKLEEIINMQLFFAARTELEFNNAVNMEPDEEYWPGWETVL